MTDSEINILAKRLCIFFLIGAALWIIIPHGIHRGWSVGFLAFAWATAFVAATEKEE